MISLLDFPVPSCLKVIREWIRWQYEIMNANIWQSTKMGCDCHLPICTNLYDEYSKVPPPLAVDQRPGTQYVMMAHVNISATWHQDLRQSDLILQAIKNNLDLNCYWFNTQLQPVISNHFAIQALHRTCSVRYIRHS